MVIATTTFLQTVTLQAKITCQKITDTLKTVNKLSNHEKKHPSQNKTNESKELLNSNKPVKNVRKSTKA